MARSIRDIGLLLARLGFALAILPFGWTKLYRTGFSTVADQFAATGIPFPKVSAGVAIAGEFGGGVLIGLGLLTPLAGLVAAVAMFGAVLTAPGHFFKGGFAHTDQGLVNVFDEKWAGSAAFVFGVAALALAVSGPGRFSLDKVFFGRSDWFGPREA